MNHKTNKNTTLITGIPRSGTTLCCNLLNKCNNVVALHEPIDPLKLSSNDAQQAVNEVCEQVANIRCSLETNKAIEHGDSAGVDIDNPIGQEVDENGLRKQKSSRGLVTLPSIDSSTRLFVKQNALFTALSENLVKHYNMFAIVRNPIGVLLSWMTVNLPVNKGRLPAGEKYDTKLALLLKEGSVFERQIAIYRWFIQKFEAANLTVVRYEDIIDSDGVALFSAFGINNQVPLDNVSREFPKETVDFLLKNWAILERLGNEAGYTSNFLEKRLRLLPIK